MSAYSDRYPPLTLVEEFEWEKTENNYKTLSDDLQYLSRLFFNYEKTASSTERQKRLLQLYEFDFLIHSFILDYLKSLNKEMFSTYLAFCAEKLMGQISHFELTRLGDWDGLSENLGRDENYVVQKLAGYMKYIGSFGCNSSYFPKFVYVALMLHPMEIIDSLEFLQDFEKQQRDEEFVQKYSILLYMMFLRTMDIDTYNKEKVELIKELPNPFK
jgi:hypothetical protein